MSYQPSMRAEVIVRRTYNRPLDKEGKVFETWAQTVARVIEHQHWLWKRALGRPLNKSQLAELEELRALILDRKALLSGRTLWLGGTEIAKRRECSQFNPGRRSTRFVTVDGVKSFEDFNDGDEIEVLTHLGNWKRARVMCAGVQPINRITFKRGTNTQVEHFTPTHTWVLKGGIRTSDLQVADVLYAPPSDHGWDYNAAPVDERYWWAYGYVYGDGAVTTQIGGTQNSRVRLCGDDKLLYLPRFKELGFHHTFPPSCDGDPIVYTGKYLKTLPPAGVERRLLRAFIYGYLAADGCKSKNFSRRGFNRYEAIQATDPEAQRFIETFFPVVGIYIINRHPVASETNFGTRSHQTFIYTLRTGFGDATNLTHYKVAAIEPVGEEEVWCLTVEKDHSFVLPNGITTGNCAFTELHTIHDVVDFFWLLLNGVGPGFKAESGALSGFTKPIKQIEVIRSTRTKEAFLAGERGRETNLETWDPETRTWTISIGDAAEAWAKSAGKLVAGKYPAEKLVLDFSEIRPAGLRLAGYGWIGAGDAAIAKAYQAICDLMNRRAGQLLRKMDIHDIGNWLGTVLSTRRSAEISLFDYGSPEWQEFATCKKDCYEKGQPQREQSNNSLVFYKKPDKNELTNIFRLMQEGGGSEPGFVNGAAGLKRAPWFKGFNPCAEILLPKKGFCNLITINVARFVSDFAGLLRAIYIMARANYRQTCVNLRDGILQDAWHQNNEFLRLCGVSMTGQAMRPDLTDYDYKVLKNGAVQGAYSMADELGLPRPKNVTTGKPEGTGSKIMDTTEGIHKPLGKYIINNVIFPAGDPLIAKLQAANYRSFGHPTRPGDVVVGLPVAYEGVEFSLVNGVEVNLDSAIAQLERYKVVMDNYCEQNQSVTISYDPTEVPAIIDWIHENWDHYVGVSFLYRNDPTKTAADLGYPYLPQQVVTKEVYDAYLADLKPVVIDENGVEGALEDDCAGGACPIR